VYTGSIRDVGAGALKQARRGDAKAYRYSKGYK
jgi:hypothetical protein